MLKDRERLTHGFDQYQAEQEKQATPIQQELTVVEELIEQHQWVQFLGRGNPMPLRMGIGMPPYGKFGSAEHNNDLNETVSSLKIVSTPRAKAAIVADLERIEDTLDRLEARRVELLEQLDSNTPTEKDFITINEWAATVAKDFETVRQDFSSKRFLPDRIS